MIEVLEAGPWTTVQDLGRPGLEGYGIPPGGPVDWYTAKVANRLAGNPTEASLLECTLAAPTLGFLDDAQIAITGGGLNGLATWTACSVPAGAVLKLGGIRPGLRAYIALRGGIAVDPVLGSRALSQLGRFGGGFGRPLRAGDRLPVGVTVAGDPLRIPWPREQRLPLEGPWEIRVIAGPHQHAFAADAVQRLADTALEVTPAVDRIGMRLRAPALRLRAEEIVTTGVPEGAIQVTPSGELIVLLAEHPTAGGYPVIATVIRADLPLLAQARPGDTVHLRMVGLEEANRARRRLEAWLT
jgi:antagonist of KipI